MDANSGLINIGAGMVVDTQSELPHARMMIELFGTVWNGMPRDAWRLRTKTSTMLEVIKLFPGADIIAHRTIAERMPTVADPEETRKLLKAVEHIFPVACCSRACIMAPRPLRCNSAKTTTSKASNSSCPPPSLTTATSSTSMSCPQIQMIHVGACHQVGDTIVHVLEEGVVFAGDIIFRDSTPMGWVGTYDACFKATLDLIISLDPKVIVPGQRTGMRRRRRRCREGLLPLRSPRGPRSVSMRD
ncbi:MAG: hypothetical protein MZV64_36310 [Ignavibacteriales bacterium]|nr:hypothetical protein [Ignavibacteriales bacterium]